MMAKLDTPFLLDGLSLWTPGYDQIETWWERNPDPSIKSPQASQLPSSLRRRTSLLTRMAIDVFERSVNLAAIDPKTTAIVFGTVYGEIQTTYDLLAMLGRDELVSPTKFHNSVHNTAIGYLSIAYQHQGLLTTISAGWSTLAMGILESLAILHAQQADQVALVLSEEGLPKPLLQGPEEVYDPLAMAMLLRPAGEQSAEHKLWQMRFGSCHENVRQLPENVRHNPCSPGLGLIDQLRPKNLQSSREPVTIPLEPANTTCWYLTQKLKP